MKVFIDGIKERQLTMLPGNNPECSKQASVFGLDEIYLRLEDICALTERCLNTNPVESFRTNQIY